MANGPFKGPLLYKIPRGADGYNLKYKKSNLCRSLRTYKLDNGGPQKHTNTNVALFDGVLCQGINMYEDTNGLCM